MPIQIVRNHIVKKSLLDVSDEINELLIKIFVDSLAIFDKYSSYKLAGIDIFGRALKNVATQIGIIAFDLFRISS